MRNILTFAVNIIDNKKKTTEVRCGF